MVTLKLLLHGMIALVLNDPDSPKTLSAYLIDSGGWRGMDGEQCVRHNHVPFLAFEITADSECPVRNEICAPRDVKNAARHCICDIHGRSIKFEPRPKDASQWPWPAKPNKVPKTEAEAGSIAWVPRLAQTDPTRARPHPPSVLKRRTIGDFTFGWKDLRTCELASVEDVDDVPYFEFKPLQGTKTYDHQQAVAEAIMAKLEFESDALVIKANRKSIPIPCKNGKCRDVIIANAMIGNGRDVVTDRCYDGRKGREFELYSDCSMTTPAHPPLVPHFVNREDGVLPKEECPPSFRPQDILPADGAHLRDSSKTSRHNSRRGIPALSPRLKYEKEATSGRPICTLVVFE